MRRRTMRLKLEGREEGFEGAKAEAWRWTGVEGYTEHGEWRALYSEAVEGLYEKRGYRDRVTMLAVERTERECLGWRATSRVDQKAASRCCEAEVEDMLTVL